MSKSVPPSPNSDDRRPDSVLAAEYVLGLLSGEELLMMRGRVAREPQLADLVEEWEERLAPLTDELSAAQPSPDVWRKIETALSESPIEEAEIISLKQRLRNWQIAGTASAAAAVAALSVLMFSPGQTDTVSSAGGEAASAPLAASVPIGDTNLRLAVTYLPEQSELLVSASGLSADGVHDHELWLVPAEGDLQSLGVVEAGVEKRVGLAPNVAAMMADGAGLVLTREPLGGKPEGVDAGPVVAEGQLRAI
jgi:anti-sigma-K factor RskA